MAHQSNSHNAPWLTSSQTEMFSVGDWSVRSSCPVVDAPATCSTSMGLLQWSCGHRSCCGSVGRCTSWRRQNAADITSRCLFTLLIVLCLFVCFEVPALFQFSVLEKMIFSIRLIILLVHPCATFKNLLRTYSELLHLCFMDVEFSTTRLVLSRSASQLTL